MSKTLTLAGRTFSLGRPRTLEAELAWFSALREGGLGMLERHPDESAAQFASRALERIADSGVTLRLMAIAAVPVGETWTPQLADETADFLGRLSADEDRIAALEVLTPVVDVLVRRTGCGVLETAYTRPDRKREGA